MAKRRLKPVPDISEDYTNLQSQNPLYYGDNPPDTRVIDELNQIFYKRNKEARTHNEIVKNIKIYQVGIQWRVKQMIDNPYWDKRKGRNPEDFKRSHRTFLKTTQEVLSADTDRIPIYRSDINNSDKLKQALNSIIIDPIQITNKLLENLGLTQYIPPKRMLQEDQVEYRAQAIPAIREMLESLEPIRSSTPGIPYHNLNYFRTMRISTGNNEGYIIGTQNIDSRKTLFKTDLYGAERRLLNIESGYQDEIRKLTWIQLQIADVQNNLKEWNDIRNTNKLDDLKKVLLACIDSLKHVRDDDKVELRDKVRECLEFKDSLGRHNPTIIRAKLSKARRYIGARLNTIGNIHKYIGQDKAKVEQIIQEEELPMQKFVRIIEKQHKQFAILKTPVLLTAAQRNKILANLEKVKAEMSTIKFQPNLAFIEKIIEQTDKVIALLSNQQDEEAKVEFVKIYLIAKIKRTQSELNDVHKMISLYDAVSLKNELERIYQDLREHKVASNIKIQDYLDQYIEVYQLFDQLIKKVNELLDPNSPKIDTTDSNSKLPFEELIDSFAERFPKVKNVLRIMKKRVSTYVKERFDIKIKRKRKDRTATKTYTVAEKNKIYEELSKMIKELDFVDLMKGIKD